MIDILLQIILNLVSGQLIQVLTLVVLFITLISVVYYTYLTYKLQKTAERQIYENIQQTEEIIRQRRLSILPSLQLVLAENPIPTPEVEVKFKEKYAALNNIGNGVALNVSFVIDFYDRKGVQNKTSYVNAIHPKESVQLFNSTKHPAIIPRLNNSKIKFVFSDIEGNMYEQINEIKNGEPKHGVVKSTWKN